MVAGAPRNSAVTLVANVTDPDGDKLHFTWAVNAGSIGAINDNTAQWILPDSPGIAFAYVLVTDGKGAFREGSTVISTDAGIVPAPPAGAAPAANPSDKLNAPDHFLTFFATRDLFVFPAKHADSRQGACQYYVAIGAVQGCGPGGELVGTQLTFNGWKAKWGLDSPNAGFRAIYANIRDLDLERDMHGIANANGTAYYVCNYPHVRGGQPDTNLLNARRGENLVACVAMGHSPTPGVMEAGRSRNSWCSDRAVSFYHRSISINAAKSSCRACASSATARATALPASTTRTPRCRRISRRSFCRSISTTLPMPRAAGRCRGLGWKRNFAAST